MTNVFKFDAIKDDNIPPLALMQMYRCGHMPESLFNSFSGVMVAYNAKTELYHLVSYSVLGEAVVECCKDGWDSRAEAEYMLQRYKKLLPLTTELFNLVGEQAELAQFNEAVAAVPRAEEACQEMEEILEETKAFFYDPNTGAIRTTE